MQNSLRLHNTLTSHLGKCLPEERINRLGERATVKKGHPHRSVNHLIFAAPWSKEWG